MIVRIVLIILVVSNDVWDSHIETLPGRLQTTWMTDMDLVAWIELSSIQTIGMILCTL